MPVNVIALFLNYGHYTKNEIIITIIIMLRENFATIEWLPFLNVLFKKKYSIKVVEAFF